MAKLTKRLKAAQAAVQPGKLYGLEEALNIVKNNAKAKFSESVDVAVRLGIDAKKSDQGVRGSSLLPHGTGKTVKVADSHYGPKTLTVGRGTKVTWRWTGVLKHNVVVHTGPSFFSSRTQVRGTFAHVFTRKGTYALVCTVHPKMKMTVVVR